MSTPDNSTPTATAISFLKCIKLRNKDGMRALSHPNATACLIREGKPVHLHVTDILDRILDLDEGGVEMDEVSHDEIEHVHGEFATVWTPYDFYEEGKLHHSGSNNFCLWKSPDKGWIITAVQDVAHPAEGVTNLTIVGGHDAGA